MDYAAIARDAGCVPTAIEDVARRCAAHFQGEDPQPETVRTWLDTLRTALPELWPAAPTLPAALQGHPSAMLGWAHDNDQVQKYDRTRRRPVYRPLTAEELDSIKDLPFHERHERGRAMQQTPLPQG